MKYSIKELSQTLRKIEVEMHVSEVSAVVEKIQTNYSACETSDRKLTEDVIDSLLADLFELEGINPICIYQCEDDLVTNRNEFSFEVYFEILPKIDLPEIATLTVDVPPPVLEPGIVDSILDNTLKRNAELETVGKGERAKEGDIAIIDLHGRVNGSDAPCLCKKNMQIEINLSKKNVYGINFSDIIQSMCLGDTKNIFIKLPEDHLYEFLRGKKIEFTLKLIDLKRFVINKSYDDIAKDIGFNDLETLKRFLYSKTMNNLLKDIKREGKIRLINTLVSKSKFEIPKSIYSSYMHQCKNKMRTLFLSYGMNQEEIEKNLIFMQASIEKESRALAMNEVYLLVLAEKEKIEVYENEIHVQIESIAKRNNITFQEMDSILKKDNVIREIHNSILANKTLDYIYDKSKKNVCNIN